MVCPIHDPLIQKMLEEGVSCLSEDEMEELARLDACEHCLRQIASTTGVSVQTLKDTGGVHSVEASVNRVRQLMQSVDELPEVVPIQTPLISEVGRHRATDSPGREGDIRVSMPGQGARRLAMLWDRDRDPERFAPAVVAEVRLLRQRGRVLLAWGALEYGMQRIQGQGLIQWERAFLVQWLHLSLQDRRSNILLQVRDRIKASGLPDAEKGSIVLLIQAQQAVDAAGSQVDLLGDLLKMTFQDVGLEYLRIGVLSALSARLDVGWEDTLNQAIAALRKLPKTPYIQAGEHQILGMLAYKRGKYAESLRHRVAASLLLPDRISKLNAKLNAAQTAIDVPDLEVAKDLALTALRHAKQANLLLYQVQARRILRSIAYHERQALHADEELVRLARLVAVPREAALVGVTEAAFSWRAKRMDKAHVLASWAAERGQGGALSLVARTLALVTGVERSEATARGLATEAIAHATPGIGLQVLGLLAGGYPGMANEWFGIAQGLSRAVTAHEVRRDVLSVNEALQLLASAKR